MEKILYMLDTNTASYIIKGRSEEIKKRLFNVPMSSICISSITEAELLHGVAKKPEATHLANIVNEFLLRVEILPWDTEAAKTYSKLKSTCENEGKSLGAMDMLIAAHSVSLGSTLITNDKAFYNVKHHMKLEDWTKSTALTP